MIKNYPFVPISMAKAAQKLGFDEPCFGIYEKGYTWKGKKIKERLYRTDAPTILKNSIEFIKTSPHYKEYLKRPGMFIGPWKAPIWCVEAPTYDQLIHWIFKKYGLLIQIVPQEHTTNLHLSFVVMDCNQTLDKDKRITSFKTILISGSYRNNYHLALKNGLFYILHYIKSNKL